jgi:hypothetical protein
MPIPYAHKSRSAPKDTRIGLVGQGKHFRPSEESEERLCRVRSFGTQRIDSMRCRFGMVKAMEDLIYIGLPAALPALEEKSNGVHFGMPSEPLLGALLRVLAASKPGGRILELGTGTGIATTCRRNGQQFGPRQRG